MLQFMNVTKALADENRIRILMALHQHGELCVCHLIDLLGLAPSCCDEPAVRAAREENRRLGIPNVFSLNGRLCWELPNGEITFEDPEGDGPPSADG